jgi:hypothetical protein
VLCLEVTVDGKRVAIAGVADAESVTANIRLLPGFNEYRLEVAGDVVPEGQPPSEAYWLNMPLETGASVEVRCVESTEPSPADLHRFDPTATATDGVPLVCAFCGKDHLSVEGMISGRNAMVCHECVRIMGDLVNDET